MYRLWIVFYNQAILALASVFNDPRNETLKKQKLMFDHSSDRSVLSVGRYIDEENQTTAREILQALVDSRASGTVIGITSTLFGRSMVLTGVVDIVLGDPSIVVLQAYDTNGYILPETKIPLETITAVRPFASKFVNPFVSKLNEDQNPLL